ncbi:hypothetical protein D3C81_2003160 [compost metagenome]
MSPAPETSKTSRARPGKWVTPPPRFASVMPLPARVTMTALAVLAASKAASAASTCSSVSVGRPVAPASSLAFGLMTSTAP